MPTGVISGPLLDRIDLRRPRPCPWSTTTLRPSRAVSPAPTCVPGSWRRALQQGGTRPCPACGATRSCRPRQRRYCRMTPAAEKILRSAFERLGYSARAYDRILRVARTVADLDGSEVLDTAHLSDAAIQDFGQKVRDVLKFIHHHTLLSPLKMGHSSLSRAMPHF